MFTHLGAMAALRVQDVDLDGNLGVRHVHVSSFFMHTGARQRLHVVFGAARASGRTTSLDTNDDPEESWDHGAQEMLGATDLLFCNEREAVGLARTAGADALSAATVLLGRLATGSNPRLPAVVLKRGADGATVLTRAGVVSAVAPKLDVIDTVGAGDTLAGTVLANLLAGADWPQALRLGVAAGSSSTTTAGGVAAHPDAAQIDALAASIPVQDARTVRTSS